MKRRDKKAAELEAQRLLKRYGGSTKLDPKQPLHELLVGHCAAGNNPEASQTARAIVAQE